MNNVNLLFLWKPEKKSLDILGFIFSAAATTMYFNEGRFKNIEEKVYRKNLFILFNNEQRLKTRRSMKILYFNIVLTNF